MAGTPMCGRYVTPQQAAAEREFSLRRSSWHFQARYNVAPSLEVPVVRLTDGEREGLMMRWGLVPFFAHGATPRYSTINARAETLATSAAYRMPWRRGQRCLLPAAGFYEWHLEADGSKTPWYIGVADQAVFGFAGLWDHSVRSDATVLLSCTIVTLPANPLLARIHNVKQRMPAILERAAQADWLGADAGAAQRTLQPYPAARLHAWPVSRRVNSPRHDGPELIAPLDSAG
ncbi:MAG: SOS response-associated peptidase [Gammaproteobacteria bacterium]|nr:SOS response-associated peptidase [Gammaproteobacteria bacterium]